MRSSTVPYALLARLWGGSPGARLRGWEKHRPARDAAAQSLELFRASAYSCDVPHGNAGFPVNRTPPCRLFSSASLNSSDAPRKVSPLVIPHPFQRVRAHPPIRRATTRPYTPQNRRLPFSHWAAGGRRRRFSGSPPRPRRTRAEGPRHGVGPPLTSRSRHG